VRQARTNHVWDAVQGAQVETDEVGDGITRVRIRSRWAAMLGFEVSAYVVGDVLVDTGFAHVRRQVVELLGRQRLEAICCTHHHEDHTGNCGPLQRIHDCPVYLVNASLRWGEGVRRLKPYRSWFWGDPGEYDAREMPSTPIGSGRSLRAIPAPGHSVTHVALWEEATGTVFTGDLFIAPGASAVMVQEDPYDLVESLNRVAAVEPRLMLTGHGLVVEDPAAKLLLKADRILRAAERSVELHRRGLPDRAVVREVFPHGNGRDRMVEVLTQGEFSRLNFVRAARLHLRDSEVGALRQ
jgi:glyoxylase-like metal-dependent hydrolase (beta-lactamase superfamily II)